MFPSSNRTRNSPHIRLSDHLQFKSDLAVVDFEDAVVGENDAMGVVAEIIENGLEG